MLKKLHGKYSKEGCQHGFPLASRFPNKLPYKCGRKRYSMYNFITESWPRKVVICSQCRNLDTGAIESFIKYPVAFANAGETVYDGWSQSHKAPSNGGPWELWEYVIGSQLDHFEWFPAPKEGRK